MRRCPTTPTRWRARFTLRSTRKRRRREHDDRAVRVFAAEVGDLLAVAGPSRAGCRLLVRTEPHALAEEFRFTLHLRTRGEEIAAKRHAQAKARRWVVERTHSWLNRFRAILIRWSKKPANYLGLLHLACGIIS